VHIALIVVHAFLAALAFMVGCSLLMVLPSDHRSPRFITYAACVWLSVVALILVVVIDWTTLVTPKRVAFGLLCGLALYLAFRTEQARRTLVARSPGWPKRLIGHIGFVLISLFDGFCIVLAIDLGLPAVVIAGAAVFGVVAGVAAIRAVVRREAGRESLAQQPT
jgi:hypothetical protein